MEPDAGATSQREVFKRNRRILAGLDERFEKGLIPDRVYRIVRGEVSAGLVREDIIKEEASAPPTPIFTRLMGDVARGLVVR